MAAHLATPSFWLDTCGDDLTPRPALPGDTTCDIAIVGAGYTGLWAAHHLLRIDATLRVVIVEKEIAGWGASGRNGGWCSALFAASWPRVTREHGRDAALRMRRTLERTVDDVGDWCVDNGVDAHYAKGGSVTLARGAAQVTRVRGDVDMDRAHGGEATRWLTPPDVAARIHATGVDGASFTPHCAAIQPARLVRGLARIVEGQGARLHEQTAALGIEGGAVRTVHGTVRADVVLRATEGYTPSLAGEHRAVAPLWSLVLATEPLPASVWNELGWAQRETLTDGRHQIIYGQRTADDRVVIGGRGAPYGFGSATDSDRGHDRTFAALEHELRVLLPAAAGAGITHRWGGVLGVPRDWMPSVGFDRRTGLGWAGGYVGDGVGCSALAGRTLADLVLGRSTDEVTLPWVGHRSRRWEPEPLRWLGIRSVAALLAAADRTEISSGRPSRRAAFAARLLGD
jgi:glycine/D-amino acid oxidase-like deaminating enzyme